ncbi:AraC-type DNA-binding protein [Pedobacter steynii]|uniref:AraC-type DNA-binding protein n=1 Tax=Pedobacter steynii TaxID=430522 RepID=A0A1G9W9U1_9SPHI|nr:AraC family transcriptional regulator [Pedobacter steynii]NQX40219.1 helix-turn-helix transcriptional regulator [Pedobacter steynii]SDM81057.1 AraC-type DNA-binding protein [Pedobacter steynii]
MKPQHLKIPNSADQSFSVRKDMLPNINNRWHYHNEIELICFHKGSGTQFVGDHINKFMPGDIVLVGKDLPHYWKYDMPCIKNPAAEEPYSTVIHFYDNFIGERFLHLPETKQIKTILEKAKRGILIRGENSPEIVRAIEKIYQSSGLIKIIKLLECLLAISNLPQVVLLSSLGFKYDYGDSEDERINDIYNFVLNNFQRRIHLNEIASIADLVPNSFCRYFKTRTGKTFSRFLLEIRIGYSCKLILENKMYIKQVCFESGFNNFASFHKSFKLITGKTPKLYQQAHTLA